MNDIALIAYLQARSGTFDTPDAVRAVFSAVAADLKTAAAAFAPPQVGMRRLPEHSAGTSITTNIEPS